MPGAHSVYRPGQPIQIRSTTLPTSGYSHQDTMVAPDSYIAATRIANRSTVPVLFESIPQMTGRTAASEAPRISM
ncbi:hypothetical protein BJL96_27695 [Burkholderia cenocepacia]|nr:hypothetical protein [Burkholderia cenocepacia]